MPDLIRHEIWQDRTSFNKNQGSISNDFLVLCRGMGSKNKKEIIKSNPKHTRSCLSCGTLIHTGTRKYCTIDCRQRLRHMLNIRTGLLKVLNAKFATFYFSNMMIVLDVLPYGSSEIFSFIYPRTIGKMPSDDFSKMANILGGIWWDEKKRSNKGYLASIQVLEKANKNNTHSSSVKPVEIKYPAVKDTALLHLKINSADLIKSDYSKIIKQAFRRQAKKHHPDHGGESSSFRRIQESYKTLLDWVENPRFVKRRGFPDKWFYSGERNAWVQPVPPKYS